MFLMLTVAIMSLMMSDHVKEAMMNMVSHRYVFKTSYREYYVKKASDTHNCQVNMLKGHVVNPFPQVT